MVVSDQNPKLREMRASGQSPRSKGLLGRIDQQSRWYWVRVLLENNAAAISIGFIVVLLLATAIWPNVGPHDPFDISPVTRLQPPSNEHWMGTDHMGRDVFARAIYGARTSLLVGAAVMFVSAFIGSVIGLVAGYYERLDTPLMRLMDGIMAFPGILLAIAIMATLGPATQNVIGALAFVYMPVIARLVRGQTLSIKNLAYVEAAKASGARDHSILSRHIFMNAISPLTVQCTFVVAFAIIAEASLSFLGAGVPPTVPTWGAMLQEGRNVLNASAWPAIVPGTFLFVTVLALNLIGDGLRDAFDPRSRGR